MVKEIVRDTRVIRRTAARMSAENYRFRSFIRRELKMAGQELDTLVGATTDRVWGQIDCTTCAHCCKTLQIDVSDEDILRLADHFGITAAEFREQYVREPDPNTKMLKSGPCVFLGEDNLCTVYEARPEDCRGYPYLHRPGFRQRSLTMISNAAVCPIVFNVWEDLKDSLKFRRKQ